MFSIYLIKNNVNGKIYIGQTIFSLEKRWHQHVLKANVDNKMLICRAINKYGPDAFSISQLDILDSKLQANWMESWYIGILKTRDPKIGYNLTAGGEGTVGLKFSNEHKKNLSEAHKWQAGENNPNYGKKFSEETKKKMSASAKQRPPRSEETRRKLSISTTQYWSRKKGNEISK
jgi:group I intron endonuclease